MVSKRRSPRAGKPRAGRSRRPWLPPVALVLLTALVYGRSLAVPILGWDDDFYFFRDVRLENVSAENLWRILTQPFFASFHPITTLTFAFDRAVWGTWVPGFHITHLAFYIGGVLGLYFLFSRILGSRSGAFVAAALYAVHTIHVEPVAWLASRKDVVCLAFYAFALLTYVRYADGATRRWGSYALSLVLAACAMLSKGYATILPAVMLAYDFCFYFPITRRRLLDKIPFLILSAAVVYLTVHAQEDYNVMDQSARTIEQRVALLAKVFALYVGRTILPVGLSAFYTVVREPLGLMPLLGLFSALALVVGFFLLRRRVPAAAFGIALFLLPLATVMNVFFTLRIWIADRYLFFPTIGSCLAIVALAMYLHRRRSAAPGRTVARSSGSVLTVMAVFSIALYSVLTLARVAVWTEPIHFWSDILRKALHLAGSGPVTAADLGRVTDFRSVPTTPLVCLARAYDSEGKNDEAARISALLSRGVGGGLEESQLALARRDIDARRWEEAVRRLKPIAEGRSLLAPQAMIWMGLAESGMGNKEASRQWVDRAVDYFRKTGQPATDAYFSVGAAEFNKGNYAEAAEWYRLAQRESPRAAKPAFFLGRALEESGNLTEAMTLYRRVADGELTVLAGDQVTIADTFLQMAVTAEKLGRPQEAVGYLEETLRRAPDHPRRDEILAAMATLRRK